VCFARRNWSIVVTGHSLGAGAAALVALYIRSFYPNSRAWAFEPPGARAATVALC
jgi:sn1-specific diacylglycerol lipase